MERGKRSRQYSISFIGVVALVPIGLALGAWSAQDQTLALASSQPTSQPDHIEKAISMAIRAVGKRNRPLNSVAIDAGVQMAATPDKTRAATGRAILRELRSAKVRNRLKP